MKNTKNIISDFFKPYFEKYPELDSFWFLIYDADSLAEEDCGVNGLRWDELCDEKMYEASFEIQKAISLLQQKSGVDVANIVSDLQKLVIKLQQDSDNSNPLNNVFHDIWTDENREVLTKKLTKYLKKDIPWKYVSYAHCVVKKDGSVEINEQDIR